MRIPGRPDGSMAVLGTDEPVPHSADIHPMRTLVRSCYQGDSRGPTTAAGASSRLATSFAVVWDAASQQFSVVHMGDGPTQASPSTKIDCRTGAPVTTKPSKVTLDELSVGLAGKGKVKIEGRVAGKNTIPLFAPGIDYKFSMIWDVHAKTAKFGFSHDRFPSYELHLFHSDRWEEIFHHPPSSKDARGLFLPAGTWIYRDIDLQHSHNSDGIEFMFPSKESDQPIDSRAMEFVELLRQAGNEASVTRVEPYTHWTIMHDDGTVYRGEYLSAWGNLVGGAPHGEGTMLWPDQAEYAGEWAGGVRNGKGAMTWPSGHRYQGGWKNGLRHGEGTMTWPAGHRYAGDWKNGERTGGGTMTWADGRSYQGDWKDGRRHGEGTMTWPAGHRYAGDWENGGRTGSGTMTWADGRRYKGDWKDGRRHGHGMMTSPEGGSIRCHGLRENDANACKWEQDKLHVNAISRSGLRYNGEWDAGPHGEGTAWFPDGKTYKGEWQRGKPHGYGQLSFPEDSFWRGKILRNLPASKTVMAAPVKSYEGEFRDGKPVDSPEGKFRYHDRPCVYRGETNSRFYAHGEGVLTCEDGSSRVGRFINGYTEEQYRLREQLDPQWEEHMRRRYDFLGVPLTDPIIWDDEPVAGHTDDDVAGQFSGIVLEETDRLIHVHDVNPDGSLGRETDVILPGGPNPRDKPLNVHERGTADNELGEYRFTLPAREAGSK